MGLSVTETYNARPSGKMSGPRLEIVQSPPKHVDPFGHRPPTSLYLVKKLHLASALCCMWKGGDGEAGVTPS